MNPRFDIVNNTLTFKEISKDKIGLARYCKSFTISLDEIQYIAISPRLAFDNETLFILIIHKENHIFFLPDEVMRMSGFEKFEKQFGLAPIAQEWEKFEYDEHYGKYDKIIYPKEYYWKDLFKDDWKLKIRRLYSWAIPKSFFGNLTT